MTLDFATLTVAGGLVAFVCGLLLVFAWTQYGGGRAALRLGGSHLVGAAAIMLLAFGGRSHPLATFLAQPLFVLAAFLALSAILAFENRATPVALVAVTGCAVAALFWLHAAGADPGLIRILQLTLITPAYFAAAAVLWQGRKEGLRARQPLVAVLFLHGVMNSVGLAEAVLAEALPFGVPSFSNWYGLIHIESMIYLIGTALFMVALLKERSESGHRIASLTDPLTGLPNRRAFFYACERMLERRQQGVGAPSTVLAIDLDRFKAVNDTFGHAVGDRVLQVFAAVAHEQLRPFDIIGRLGGEEFAVLLPRTHARQGAEIADRLRAAFSEGARIVDGHEVQATLSVGVAVVGNEVTIAEALERADAALYLAKLNGRDRVELDAAAGRNIRLVG